MNVGDRRSNEMGDRAGGKSRLSKVKKTANLRVTADNRSRVKGGGPATSGTPVVLFRRGPISS
jgi:hypothetical protein